MSSLYRILWGLVLLVAFITASTFFVWVFVTGVVIAGVYSIYKYAVARFKAKNPRTKHFKTTQQRNTNFSQPYQSGEIVDMPTEYTDKKD